MALGFFLGSLTSVAHADDATPAPAPIPTQPVVSEPTAPPVVVEPTTPPVEQLPTASTDLPPVGVAREHTTPIVRVSEPNPVPTAAESSGPTGYDTGAGSVNGPGSSGSTGPGVIGMQENGNPAGTVPPGGVAPSASSGSPGVTLPPLDTSQASSGDSNLSLTYSNQSAQAPAELSCSGKDMKGPASPFLVAPYVGWTDIISFLDHDSPDYAVDGSIVIANGLRADASGGQESDMFPAYWSPELRQYVNYDGHNGYDFTISYQPVLAAGTGTVSFAGWTDSGYGNMVLINHHNGYTTLYGHLSELHVKKGDNVVAGQEIGISGSTGRSSGPHLHFSVFHNCEVTDPYGWTGNGNDPLTTFDGEHAQYLWLPGHDPLVVNPPPHWPAYPTGLKLDAAHLTTAGVANRIVPAVDRLLLLRLPSPHDGDTVQPAVAVARTEALMSQEAQALTPALQQLKRAGYVDAYEAIPAAAAIWVRGTASAGQLEALPGVASLAGVRPADLQAAQTGLAHSVLVQMGKQPAPSLWPAGFRSALQAWRPVTTAAVGDALVAGAALPGQKVSLVLKRHRQVVARAAAYGDAENGGFAATLHDANGQPVAVQPGDSLNLVSGSRFARVTISPLRVRARVRTVSGQSSPRASVPLTVTDLNGTVLWHTVVAASPLGNFRVRVPFALAAGCEAVVSGADGAGNQQAATGYVPGMTLDLTRSRVNGWVVGREPYLQLFHRGRLLETRPLRAASDGTFALDLRTKQNPAGLRPGDRVTIGSHRNRRAVFAPGMRVRLTEGSRKVELTGPPRAQVRVDVTRPGTAKWSGLVRLSGQGRATILDPKPASSGEMATATADVHGGDSVSASASLLSLRVYLGTGAIRGVAPPGTNVSISASDKGSRVGSAIASSDTVTGAVEGDLEDALGVPARLGAARTLTIGDGASTVQLAVPQVFVKIGTSGVVTTRLPAHRAYQLELVYAHRTVVWRRTAGATGAASAHIPDIVDLRKAVLTVPLGSDVSVVRVASLVHGHHKKVSTSRRKQ